MEKANKDEQATEALLAAENGSQERLACNIMFEKVIELMIGVLIIAWLGTQYGRLIRQRLLANKQKKSGNGGEE
ncbi:hypothetical protein ANCDUO_05745 [Ancylostoma duodenale]|uniref:Uncharacterized protein n=1 Tax=Ancylostoma duodenale TaxID=51022 RepID=A0A0C2DMV4_9BILA|nr:hypothetical protein ANCDUO_05745 [Ancylostoma duodenale]